MAAIRPPKPEISEKDKRIGGAISKATRRQRVNDWMHGRGTKADRPTAQEVIDEGYIIMSKEVYVRMTTDLTGGDHDHTA